MLKEEVEEPGACGTRVGSWSNWLDPLSLVFVELARSPGSIGTKSSPRSRTPSQTCSAATEMSWRCSFRRPSAARLLSFDPGNPSQLSSAMESSFSVAGSSTIVLQIRERKLVSSNGHSWLIFKSGPLSLDNYFLIPKLSDLQNRPL